MCSRREGWEVLSFPAIAETDEVHRIETIWGPRDVEHAVAADGEASGMAAWARHVDIPGRAARLEIDADHPAAPATDAQAVAAIGGDVNGAIIPATTRRGSRLLPLRSLLFRQPAPVGALSRNGDRHRRLMQF
jgi:hypothetical protein